MTIADDLEVAGVEVIRPAREIGRPGALKELKVRYTRERTGSGDDILSGARVAADVNGLAIPNQAFAFIDHLARVWLLSDGPISGVVGLVYVEAADKDSLTPPQTVALAALTAASGVKVTKPKKKPARPEKDDREPDPISVDWTFDPVAVAATFTAPSDMDEFLVEHDYLMGAGWAPTVEWIMCDPGEVVTVVLPSEIVQRDVMLRLKFRNANELLLVNQTVIHSTG